MGKQWVNNGCPCFSVSMFFMFYVLCFYFRLPTTRPLKKITEAKAAPELKREFYHFRFGVCSEPSESDTMAVILGFNLLHWLHSESARL
jgi:hypothetical protein